MDNRQILSEILVQILGFAIVFFILKKLAWKNLLGTIDHRRQTIEDRFKDIENQKASLADLEKEYAKKLENIEEACRVKIQEASNVGVALARDIQEKARTDAQKMLDRAKAELEHDLAQAKITMRREIVELSGLMAEKVITEKIDPKEHERLVDRFLKELERVN